MVEEELLSDLGQMGGWLAGVRVMGSGEANNSTVKSPQEDYGAQMDQNVALLPRHNGLKPI